MYGSSISDIKAAHTQTNKDVKTQDMIPDSWDIKGVISGSPDP